LKREISVAGTSNVYVAVFIIVSPFLGAKIRVFCETTKFLGCFFNSAQLLIEIYGDIEWGIEIVQHLGLLS